MHPTVDDSGLSRLNSRRLAEVPEANLFLFGFLLHFVWELLQIPWFQGMADAPHQDATWMCTRATFGDAVITVLSFWAVAVLCGRGWIARPTRLNVAAFAGVGVAITIVLEILSTKVWSRWAYSDAMPVIPGIDVGVIPIAQWLILPPLVLWIVRRQIHALANPQDVVSRGPLANPSRRTS